MAIILDADHVGFSFSSLFFVLLSQKSHYELYEQVFAIDLVSLPISTSISSEATREKTSVTFSQSLNLSVVVRCLDVIYLKLKYVARNVRPVAASFRLLLAGSWRTVSICIQKSSHRISFCFPYFSSSLWVFSALAYCCYRLSLSNILTTPQWISFSLEACAQAGDLLRMFFSPFYDLHKNLLSIPVQTAVQRQKIIPVLIFLLGLYCNSHPFQPQSLVFILCLSSLSLSLALCLFMLSSTALLCV